MLNINSLICGPTQKERRVFSAFAQEEALGNHFSQEKENYGGLGKGRCKLELRTI